MAGQDGEKKVLSFLREALHHQSATVLHDFHVRIPNAYAIQIDFIVFTKSYILLLEVKNIKGSIRLQHSPAQLVRTMDGVTQAMDCPFTQMTRNVLQFKKLLGNQQLPIYTAIVWTNRSAVIEPLLFDAPHPLLFLKQLPGFISRLPTDEVNGLSVSRLVKQTQMKATLFRQINLCERYAINPLELTGGLQCMNCYSLARLFEKSWVCMKCKCRINTMLTENICLLFHFVGEELPLRTFQQFIPSLRSRNLKELILSGRIQISGNRRGRHYRLNPKTKVNWVELTNF